MTHEATARQAKILSAGIIPVHFGPDGPSYLLLRCYQYWDFPKGGVHEGEEPLAAAERELEEETTLTHPRFVWGHEYRETEPYARGKIARYYLAEVTSRDVSLPVVPALGVPEHHEFRWVDYRQARALVSLRVRPILDWAHAKIAASARRPSER